MAYSASASRNFATVPELAAEWRVTEVHLYKLIQARRLPAFRIGRRVIVDRRAAQEFLEANATVRAA